MCIWKNIHSRTFAHLSEGGQRLALWLWFEPLSFQAPWHCICQSDTVPNLQQSTEGSDCSSGCWKVTLLWTFPSLYKGTDSPCFRHTRLEWQTKTNTNSKWVSWTLGQNFQGSAARLQKHHQLLKPNSAAECKHLNFKPASKTSERRGQK